jgi:hypothetical protein
VGRAGVDDESEGSRPEEFVQHRGY